jgi:hypothetical protein
MLGKLSSKPADQNHVTSEDDVTYHCLTHICIISPVLQKKKCIFTNIERIGNFKLYMNLYYSVLGIIDLFRFI